MRQMPVPARALTALAPAGAGEAGSEPFSAGVLLAAFGREGARREREGCDDAWFAGLPDFDSQDAPRSPAQAGQGAWAAGSGSLQARAPILRHTLGPAPASGCAPLRAQGRARATLRHRDTQRAPRQRAAPARARAGAQDEPGCFDWTLAAGLVPGAPCAARPGSAGLLLPLRRTGRSPALRAASRSPALRAPAQPPGESQAVLLGAIKLLLGCVETRLAPGDAAARAGAPPGGAGPVHDAVFEAALALYRHGGGEGGGAAPAPPGAPAAPRAPGTATSRVRQLSGAEGARGGDGRESPPSPAPPARTRVQRRAAAAAEASIRASKRALEGSAEPDSPPPSRARRLGARHSRPRRSPSGSDGGRAARPRPAAGLGTASSPFRGVSRHRCAALL